MLDLKNGLETSEFTHNEFKKNAQKEKDALQ